MGPTLPSLVIFNRSSKLGEEKCFEAPFLEITRRDNIDERGRFVEGDMIFPNYLDTFRPTKFDPRWKNAIVVFTIDNSFTEEELEEIGKSFTEISEKTCVRFLERTTERDFVFIQRGVVDSGCWSFVGRVGGKQIINLEPPICIRNGSISHEILHTLGRVHEQSRFDRDSYVSIDYLNVVEGLESNFRKYSMEQRPSYGIPYDYGSIMHYSAYAFARNPEKPTIIPKQIGVDIGQRIALSLRDAQTINRIYSCQPTIY
ncbi:unnamed protein product [Allacma fusca]|uniref:Peptidase M12A domain-containing protein n=1 Tax=Allacma fusca TaxID=39272 RepID=A0A8J2PR79_9HEXA|nr:unnamed protein product [Allacma fusca]